MKEIVNSLRLSLRELQYFSSSNTELSPIVFNLESAINNLIRKTRSYEQELTWTLLNTDIHEFLDFHTLIQVSSSSPHIILSMKATRESMIEMKCREKIDRICADIHFDFIKWRWELFEDDIPMINSIRDNIKCLSSTPRPDLIPLPWIRNGIENFALFPDVFEGLLSVIMTKPRLEIASVILPDILFFARAYGHYPTRFHHVVKLLQWLAQDPTILHSLQSHTYLFHDKTYPNQFATIFNQY